MFSDIQQQLTKLEQEVRNIKKNQTCEKQDGKGWWQNDFLRLNEDDSVDLMLIQFHFLSFLKLFIRTVPKFTSLATRSVVYTKSILMV